MSQKKETINEEEALESALSPMVNRLIDKNFENSGDKIASQIAPLIGGAIREQIKSQKDDIVDALYPVMGNMISKFVTKSLEELLNKINDQIQNGLSTKAIKRKIKAKIKGVSETELLLEESSEAKIKAALLIHKESGSLLCKVEDENAGLSDADMLASMMSAIRSFVNEWVDANASHQELGEIEYGGNKIIIEASGYSYLAVIVEGPSYTKTYAKIRSTLEQIVFKYADDIKKFQGNFENFPKKSIEDELKNLLQSDDNPKQKEAGKKHPIIYLLPLILIAYLSWNFYNNYQDEQLQKSIEDVLYNTPQLTPFRIDSNVDDKVVTLKGNVPFEYHKKLAQQKVENITDIKELHNNIKVTPTLTDPMQVSANIAYLIKGVNLNRDTNINYNFDYNKLTLEGYTASRTLKEQLLKALSNIKGIESIQENISLKEPNIDTDIYFDTASSKLNDATIAKLTDVIKKLKESNTKTTIELKAYSDMIGDKKSNRALAQKRVTNIVHYLKTEGELQNSIESKVFDTPPPGIDPQKNPKKARRITLTLKKENN